MADGLYDDLINRMLEAQEQMIYDGFRANSVIINGKRYGKLYHFINKKWDGLYHELAPCIAGLHVDGAMLPDDFDFIVYGAEQYKPEPREKSYRELEQENKQLRKALESIREVLKLQ